MTASPPATGHIPAPARPGPPRVVVVGSGIAGLTAALHAVAGGCRVTLVTKGALEQSNTRYAQGGIAAALLAGDRVDDHVRDTLAAGAGLSDEAAVRVLAEEGPARVRELIALGVGFDRDADGALAGGLEAAHSFPRVLHAGGDATGLEIERALVARVRASAIAIVEHAFLVDVVLRDGRVAGARLLLDPGFVEADAVVLATGGAGQLYAHTTNPALATGDGVAAALRAGADVSDLEFVQFHPTVLPAAAEGLTRGGAFLISEAVRGEGAVLVDDDGERFVLAAHPDGELAPRDVVARAIAARMAAQGGRPVRLDATALGARLLARRFPTIDRALRERGLDWGRTPVPVTPAAHYVMGGVTTDLDGRTSVAGLYAVGETARAGVHGANRLASNSLLEGAVFGARAGDAIAADAASRLWPAPRARTGSGDLTATGRSSADRPVAAVSPDPVPARPAEATSSPDPVPAPRAEPFTRAALQELMWAAAGLERTGDGLRHAASVLAAWRRAERRPRTRAEHEDENLLLVAEHLVASALRRTGSVGAHFRADEAPAARRVLAEAVVAC